MRVHDRPTEVSGELSRLASDSRALWGELVLDLSVHSLVRSLALASSMVDAPTVSISVALQRRQLDSPGTRADRLRTIALDAIVRPRILVITS